jgi:hypothetical protein
MQNIASWAGKVIAMRSIKPAKYLMMAVALALTASPAWADDASGATASESAPSDYGSVRGLALSGDAGYYTYGMDDVNNHFNHGEGNAINGGMGYGVAAKLGLTRRLAAKVGIDYLFASRDASRTISDTTYNTTVNLPATMLFVGGEYVLLPLRILNVKVIGGYTLTDIYNGDEKGSNGNERDFGAITGSGSGFQAGLGAELFLASSFSLQADLAYNYAKINNATFAGSTADPGSTDRNGAVDYSGLVAKLALNIYLFR